MMAGDAVAALGQFALKKCRRRDFQGVDTSLDGITHGGAPSIRSGSRNRISRMGFLLELFGISNAAFSEQVNKRVVPAFMRPSQSRFARFVFGIGRDVLREQLAGDGGISHVRIRRPNNRGDIAERGAKIEVDATI